MSKFYNPKRNRNIFDPASKEPYELSRTKLDMFLECPRCFYLDRRLGIDRPAGYPLSLNTAVDALLKREFDIHRRQKSRPPLLKEHGVEAVPFSHEKIEEWRDARNGGVKYFHPKTNFILKGAIDDLWINPKGELLVVEYKATAKSGPVSIDEDWQESYKRQIEFYQWLLRKNKFEVSDLGYFVYCNGLTDKELFDKKIEFEVSILPYEGRDDWVEGTLIAAKECLMSDTLPYPDPGCDYCRYRAASRQYELSFGY